MIRLYAVNVLPLQDEACFERCYSHSSKQRREKADTLKMPGDKARCIATGLLLEYAYKKFRIEKTKELAIANSFGYVQNPVLLPEQLPEIVEGVRGKPEFVWPEGDGVKCYFNLSHSGNYVICVMADFEVGTDIQMRTSVRDSLLRRFFSEEEKNRMEMCGEDENLRERTFARIWALKEAQTKLTGLGIGQLLGDVQRDGDEENDLLSKEKNYRIWQGMIDEDHAWAVACYPAVTSGEPGMLDPVVVDEGEIFYEGMF